MGQLSVDEIKDLLGEEADSLCNYKCEAIPTERIHTPTPQFIETIWERSDRNNRVLNNLDRIFNQCGRLAGSGYLSILPVDQGIEHTAAASFYNNISYFDPEEIVQLAIKGGRNAFASTLGVMGIISRRYARQIPFIVKLNHSELLTKPEISQQTMFADVDQANDLGAAAVGATIYFGSPDSRRQIIEVSQAFKNAHQLGLVTVLWCYLRNKTEFVKEGKDYHIAADLESQADHIGVTIEADLIKQKIAESNGGFVDLGYGKPINDPAIYEKLGSNHPIDWNRLQVANCYMGRVGLINSGGASGDNDLADAVKSAVINKRSGGVGLILGRKAFKKSLEEGIEILHAVQDVYLCQEIDLA